MNTNTFKFFFILSFIFFAIVTAGVANADGVNTLSRAGNAIFSDGNTSSPSSISIPSDLLKHTDSGSIMLNTASSDRSDNDDPFRKKPRPYLDTDNLLTPSFSFEKTLLELLDYIQWLLDKPQEELTESQLEASITELEALYEERQQRNKKQEEEALRHVLGNNTHESSTRFTHHPGYQAHHPAHLKSSYTVPGILAAPLPKSSNSQQRHSSESSDEKKRSAASYNHHSPHRKRTNSGDDDDNQPPPQKAPFSGQPVTEPPKTTVYKNITVAGKTYEVKAELRDNEEDLFCAICYDLIAPSAIQCSECGYYLCQSHLEDVQDQCPSCRKECDFNHASLKRRIDGLEWNCPFECGYQSHLINIKSHIPKCDTSISYGCAHDHCAFTGSFNEVSAHEQKCLHRTVSLGPLAMEQGQLAVIQEQMAEIEDGVYISPEEMTCNPELTVAFLVRALQSIPAVEIQAAAVNIPCQHNCGYTAPNQAELNEHLSLFNCPLKPVECDFCHTITASRDYVEHLKNCPMAPAECPYGCNAPGLTRKDIDENTHYPDCQSCALPCEHCREKMTENQYAQHKSVCQKRPKVCHNCIQLFTAEDLLSHKCSSFLGSTIDLGGHTLIRNGFSSSFRFQGCTDEVFLVLKNKNPSEGVYDFTFSFAEISFTLAIDGMSGGKFSLDATNKHGKEVSCSADLISTDGTIIRKLEPRYRQNPRIGFSGSGLRAGSGFTLKIPDDYKHKYIIVRLLKRGFSGHALEALAD